VHQVHAIRVGQIDEDGPVEGGIIFEKGGGILIDNRDPAVFHGPLIDVQQDVVRLRQISHGRVQVYEGDCGDIGIF